MPEIRSYKLAPTDLIPNSPYPLIHYANCFTGANSQDAATIHEHFAGNGWQTQWIFRYGPTQPSHYHSAAHECMAVLSGSATIRFGVADTEIDPESNTHGEGKEMGGIELQANAGDVFLIPAGVSHKTFDAEPAGTLKLLTAGGGHGIAGADAREVLAGVELSGFTMLGAYPQDSVWDFAEGGDHVGEFEKVWSVPKPRLDPIMGLENGGICGLWD